MTNVRMLTKKQIEELKNILLREKEKLIFNDVYRSDEFNVENEDRSDEVDQANADVRNAERLRFRNREVFYEKKIQKSLKQINDEEYGDCEECGCGIGFQRLKARPTATMCINCKEETEKDENSNIFLRQSKSLGKKIDIVKAL